MTEQSQANEQSREGREPAADPSAAHTPESGLRDGYLESTRHRAISLDELHSLAPDYDQYLPESAEAREAFLKRSYGDEDYEESLGKLEEISPEAAKLIKDPGVVQHLSALQELVAEKPDLKEVSAADLRTELSESLGTVTIYRGMDRSQAELIESTGRITPRVAVGTKDKDARETLDYQEVCIQHSVGDKARYGDSLKDMSGLVISVSHHRDAAIALSMKIHPDGTVYRGDAKEIQEHHERFKEGGPTEHCLLIAEVPKLSLVSFEDKAFSWGRYEEGLEGQVNVAGMSAYQRELFGPITAAYGRDLADYCKYGADYSLQVRTPNGEQREIPMVGDDGKLVELFAFGDLPLAKGSFSIERIPAGSDKLRWTGPLPWVSEDEQQHYLEYQRDS